MAIWSVDDGGQVAQSVEQKTENLRVGSSILPLPIFSLDIRAVKAAPTRFAFPLKEWRHGVTSPPDQQHALHARIQSGEMKHRARRGESIMVLRYEYFLI